MIAEVLLILPLYLILFFIWWWFRRLIKLMASVWDILNDNEFFGNVGDTPKEGIEQHKKREELKSVIDKVKAHLLGRNWTHGRTDKASDEVINKTYSESRMLKSLDGCLTELSASDFYWIFFSFGLSLIF